ncbi:hypothetical protein GGH19_005261 [Coemansia sp. RSA 1807]|nr:hypothetical protein LPJ58_001959 [Coemansia sp. RSA 1591]KAJ1764364.1 hypothetical protein LPJ69_001891 [Coemansia sp. RSA 1752]KAJ1786929.1 hypothetical protein LPJ62_003598 [Coemansia sp. RSA 2167]KAJ1791349.1 hypothetical protein LPJ67_001881 [Coemansia sp. RSA 1938]KAJ2142147.1 hypothetical protein IW142_004472 [Coemansia sp. RSA 564]KAJ2168630.1 hypothetical protein GGH15_001209 [Coemansia sp. RSA 562]KAJ2189382.1 hypothetical protein EV181_001653 [Coemansia sp. RSA 532]KAJ2199155.1
MGSGFKTLERQRAAVTPGQDFEYPDAQNLTAPHIESFDSIWEAAGPRTPALMDVAMSLMGKQSIFDGKQDMDSPFGTKITFWVDNVRLDHPSLTSRETKSSNRLMYPTECRQRSITYRGRLSGVVHYQVGDNPEITEERNFGQLPVMVRSNRCNLQNMGPADLVKKREEPEEMGGYFVINGNEKVIRLLIAQRRNHILAIQRPSYGNRGPGFTPFATQIRCVRRDQTSQTLTMHYLTTGNLLLRFALRKQEYMVPVSLLMRALVGATDREIFEAVIGGDAENIFVRDRVELLLRSSKDYAVYTREQALAYLGDKFRVVMYVAEDMTNAEIGQLLIDRMVMVHLDDARDKFNMLAHMVRKLYAVVSGECQEDNPDTQQMQEVYMPGHLYLGLVKEKIEDYLLGVRSEFSKDARNDKIDLYNRRYVSRVLARVTADIGHKAQYFLATGNLITRTGLDMQQMSGYTIIAEKLNYLRYLSHFRCIHRGAFFAELKTTGVRKLLPEGWGFLCPVHTPDGSPCGLLNHLAHKCGITTVVEETDEVERTLVRLGVEPGLPRPSQRDSQLLTVQLDGRIVGYCSPQTGARIAQALRALKLQRKSGSKTAPNIPFNTEIGFVPPSHGGQLPGLFLFTTPARFVRPVTHLGTTQLDHVGSFEQVYMEIGCLDADMRPGVTTHQEILPTHILSAVANFTPFCDFNQSPRNMYQCQMGKQTMGTPMQSYPFRTDNKLYRLQTGQTPICRPRIYDDYGVDNYPNGMNAVVAVISYTGYDMEDAMILNKSAHERGFGYGTIYKTEYVDLGKFRKSGDPISTHFGVGRDMLANDSIMDRIDMDGLPYPGVRVEDGLPLYAVVDDIRGRTKVVKYKGEAGFVETVRLLASSNPDEELQVVAITFRIPRSPIIGDKFSSRHGQKGVCSQKFPAVDMPFTETGMQPDVIINPHAFPSRMTIGMFVESIAAKAGSLHGVCQDATPFQFNETHTAADYFGEQLRKAGYNFHGSEPMYSGVTGQEMRADIYIGVVYYQRLRHMVSDKYQVRTTGPINPLTQQPIKGRKRGGGIRLGEMERDALIAHGAAYFLQDRLMNCSDYSLAYVCKCCGSILAPIAVPATSHAVNLSSDKTDAKGVMFAGLSSSEARAIMASANTPMMGKGPLELVCRLCKNADGITMVALPYVFRYLATELMSMNMKVRLDVK